MNIVNKSDKLRDVCYDIRGPVLEEALKLEEEGHYITKLNIGNPAAFSLHAPDEILKDVIRQLPHSQGYCESKGLYSARKAVMQYCQEKQIDNVDVDDIILGNGVSELIVMATQALLNNDDEVLIPSPDYPLWSAATSLSGGIPRHYVCDEESQWFPDMDDIRKKTTDKTKAIVLINPNNPTGAVYSKELLLEIIEHARQHNLIVFSDEIYDKIIFDDAEHISTASLADDVLFITFNGLSKSYRVAGFRAGWAIISGAKDKATDFIEGLNMLASMRLCANVPAQHAIQTSLGGYQSIKDLVLPKGRLYEQRNKAWEMITSIPGITCVKPKGAIYLFPKIDTRMYPIKNDETWILELLKKEHLLLVQGTAFNFKTPDHFRIVFLPRVEDLKVAIEKVGRFLQDYAASSE